MHVKFLRAQSRMPSHALVILVLRTTLAFETATSFSCPCTKSVRSQRAAALGRGQQKPILARTTNVIKTRFMPVSTPKDLVHSADLALPAYWTTNVIKTRFMSLSILKDPVNSTDLCSAKE